jgi:c-di-GMP-binding flagellar brake protein YcgR
MERRTSDRISVLEDAQVVCQNLGVVRATVHDISLGGVCVDTGSIRLPVSAAVTVRFTIDEGGNRMVYRAHALVMRHDEHGCRLMFDYMDDRTHQALRSLVGDWRYLPESTPLQQAADC